MIPIKDPLQDKGNTQIEVEVGAQIFQANGNDNNAWVKMLISDKIGFNSKAIEKYKE